MLNRHKMELRVEFKVQYTFLLCVRVLVCVRSSVYRPTLEGVWLCPSHSQHLSPRTPEPYRGVQRGIWWRQGVVVFPLGVSGVWMVEGDNGELLYSISTGKMEEVELDSADLVEQLQQQQDGRGKS